MQYIKTSLYKNWHLLALSIFFILSRVLIGLAGVQFSAEGTLDGAWQLVDRTLLQNRLMESLWYLHTQPPLFNLFVGLVTKLFPENYTLCFALIYHFLGWIIAITMLKFLLKLKLNPFISFVIALIWVLCPTGILFEYWLFYEFPVVALLMVSALGLFYFDKTEKTLWLAVFIWCLTLVVLTRSMFHPVYLLFLLGLLYLIKPPLRHKIVLTSIIPIMVLLAWPMKNYYLVNKFTYSTWYGMNLFKVAGKFMPSKERHQLVLDGTLPKVCHYMPFARSINDYAAFIPLKPNPFPNSAMMADSLKQNGEVNYHNFQSIEISDDYAKGARFIYFHRPLYYLKSIFGATLIYFETPTRYFFFNDNRVKIDTYEKLWHPFLYNINGERHKHYVDLLAIFLFGFVGCWLLYKVPGYLKVKLKSLAFTSKEICLGFVLITIGYVTLVGIMAEFGENMRFRFQVIPFGMIILAFVMEEILKSCNQKTKNRA